MTGGEYCIRKYAGRGIIAGGRCGGDQFMGFISAILA
jgi:hypothetical protein